MTVPSSNELICLEHIGKDYPIISTGAGRLRTVFELLTGRAVHDYYRAIEDISLTIHRGESWGIIGENGAGKSTLLKIIAGVVKASTGTVVVQGRVSALLELGTGFHPEYSGRDNVFLASALMGWTRAETHSQLDAILRFADIGTHIDQPVKTYSSGMVVRLGFAVATALSPDLLVTDEVLAVGDESFQKKCLRWMEDFRARGGTFLLCSHSMYHVQSLCQRTMWIHGGKMHMQGESFEVTQAYLAHHEAKNRKDAPAVTTTPALSAPFPMLAALWTEDKTGTRRELFDMAEDVWLCGTFQTPEDQPTVLMAGVVRMDGTPVFGTFSNDAGFNANRLAPRIFGFRVIFRRNALLPGRYHLRAHTLDDHGLRMFDTREVTITIRGQTRDHGFVRLEHEWGPGHKAPR
ncbi:MAG: polysaccharide ABC transporter ATP-binding protein [Burkholderiales bacterium]|nr:polysaccharide ABC transporter ATP-binding protein [Burkholderiales bacterium]